MINAQKMLFMLSSLLMIPAAFAQGDRVGLMGGSDVVICNENGKEVRTLRDLYDAKKKGSEIKIKKNLLTPEEVIKSFKKEFKKIDPVRADQYSNQAIKILNDLKALSENKPRPNGIASFAAAPIPDVDYEDESFSSDTCRKQQLSKQVKEPTSNTVSYEYDADLFGGLNPLNQALAILRDVVHTDLRDETAEAGKSTRQMLSFLSGLNPRNMLSYLKFVSDQSFNHYTLRTNLADLPLYNLENGKTKQWIAAYNQAGAIRSVTVDPSGARTTSMQVNNHQISRVMGFTVDQDLQVKKLIGNFDVFFDATTNKLVAINTLDEPQGATQFTARDAIIQGKNIIFIDSIRKQSLIVRKDGTVQLNFKIKRAHLR